MTRSHNNTSTLKLNDESGQVILLVIVIMMVFILGMELLVNLVSQETKTSVKTKRTTTAFHLAEAGLDRGVWKMQESSSVWDDIVTGTKIEGYRGYTSESYKEYDSAGKLMGEYAIDIASTSQSNVVRVFSKAKDASSYEVRAIEAYYRKQVIVGPIDVDSTIEYKPNLTVHWGPVVTYGSIEMSPTKYYPRKISKGRIVGRDVDQSSPNTDDLEYWAYEDLGNPPRVDLAYYKTLAIASQVLPMRKGSGSGAATAFPSGSGYFRAADNPNGYEFRAPTGSGNYTFENSTSVIYVEGNASLPSGKCWLDVAALIVTGDCDFNADFQTYGATIPVGAQNEYLHPSAQGFWTTNFAPIGEGGIYSISSCGMHGFLYVGGKMSNAGANAIIVGAIKVIGQVTLNTMTVYYDSTVTSEIHLTSSNAQRISWNEVVTSW
ncbi:MAG: hypothetical protein WC955_05695 [Elusimicrobiota bacterium]